MERLNVSLEAEPMGLLKMIAKERHLPPTTFARQILLEKLDDMEDEYWGNIALERMENNKGEYISHEDAWKHLESK
jgi:predicted DNA-binding protein